MYRVTGLFMQPALAAEAVVVTLTLYLRKGSGVFAQHKRGKQSRRAAVGRKESVVTPLAAFINLSRQRRTQRRGLQPAPAVVALIFADDEAVRAAVTWYWLINGARTSPCASGNAALQAVKSKANDAARIFTAVPARLRPRRRDGVAVFPRRGYRCPRRNRQEWRKSWRGFRDCLRWRK